MLDATSAGIPTHHVSIVSLIAAVSGACVGYCACRWSSRPRAAARAAVQRIHYGQLDACKIEQTDGMAAASQKVDPYDPLPRKGFLSWDDYFMAVAFLSAQRSKDPNKQVGACIVSRDQIILGIGYNGFPRGCPDSELPWAKLSRNGDPLETKYPYVCHAELNAILNKNTASLHGAKMYVTMFPCNECSKLLIQAGIREIVYYEDKAAPVRDTSPNEAAPSNIRHEDAYAASKRLLNMTGVKLRQHQLDRPLVFSLGT